jgi:predicted aspartyl protease
MPIRNAYWTKPGTVLDLDPDRFRAQGPLIQVEVSLHPAAEANLQNANLPIPAPIPGTALIDTGASVSSVDESIVSQLGIPAVGTSQVFTPGGQVLQQLHPCRIWFPGASLPPITFGFVLAGILKAQGIDVLLGRDVLRDYVLVYNGPGAHYTIVG